MSLLDYFRSNKKQNTAQLAKERLQIIVAHERSSRGGPDYLPQLKQDILDVIRKYVNIDPEKITVQLDQKSDELSVLELNITFADDKKGWADALCVTPSPNEERILSLVPDFYLHKNRSQRLASSRQGVCRPLE